jgi:hypothetical protein
MLVTVYVPPATGTDTAVLLSVTDATWYPIDGAMVTVSLEPDSMLVVMLLDVGVMVPLLPVERVRV